MPKASPGLSGDFFSPEPLRSSDTCFINDDSSLITSSLCWSVKFSFEIIKPMIAAKYWLATS